MVLADSPLACIRCARATFDWSSAFGRPMDCPRARRASRAAVRRSLPSSNSSSARLARTPATMRPEACDVSMPSRSDRSTIPRSPRSRMVVITSAALRPRRSMPTTTMASPCLSESSSAARPCRRSRQLVGVDAGGANACCVGVQRAPRCQVSETTGRPGVCRSQCRHRDRSVGLAWCCRARSPGRPPWPDRRPGGRPSACGARG